MIMILKSYNLYLILHKILPHMQANRYHYQKKLKKNYLNIADKINILFCDLLRIKMDNKTLKWLSVPLLAGSLLSGYYLWNRESQFDNPTRIVEVPPIALIEERKDNSNSNTNNNPISPIINNKSGESGDDNVNSSKSQNENASAQPNPTNTSQPKKSLEEILSFNRYLNYNYLENLDYEARLKALDEAKQNNDALALFGEYVNLRLFNLALQIAPQLGVGNDIAEEF